MTADEKRTLRSAKAWSKSRVYYHLDNAHARHLPHSPAVYAAGWLRDVHIYEHQTWGATLHAH